MRRKKKDENKESEIYQIGKGIPVSEARALAGAIPPFSLAFFRWSIIAVGLAPFVLTTLKGSQQSLFDRAWSILAR